MMMPNSANSISNYTFSKSDRLFLDTNIWLDLYGPIGNPNDKVAGIYSRAYDNILQAGCVVFINSLVVSEFVNRFARIEFARICTTVAFKNFRNSNDFIPVAHNIADALRRIKKDSHCVSLDDGFASMDYSGILLEFEAGGHDFNDQLIVRLCVAANLKLISNDRDISRYDDIALLTANNRLLQT